MSLFDENCEIEREDINGHSLITLTLADDRYEKAVTQLSDVVPDHYIDPLSIAHALERLGKPAAAEKLRVKLPQTKNIRSGDLGEILATEYVNEHTDYIVPIKKLRWCDHREMAMRGDDVIGLRQLDDNLPLDFLKTEAKSRATASTKVLEEARAALDADESRPAPHALAFVADRLRESGAIGLADLIGEAHLKYGLKSGQLEHLLFLFSGSRASELQKHVLESYEGDIAQMAVTVRAKEHQAFVADVFEKVIDGLDD